MKRKAILPNIITAFGLSCGVFVIFKMNMIEPQGVTYHNVLAAVGIIMFAAFLDLLDGAIARAMKAESEFGGVFDSMADAVAFGIAPAVIVLKTLSMEPKTPIAFLLTTAAMVYSISGVLRLVRFTVTNSTHADIEKKKEAKANFTGLPITAAAVIVLSTTLLLMSDELRAIVSLSSKTRAYIVSFVFFTIGYFMVSRWKFLSFKTLRIRIDSFQLMFLTVLVSAFILVGALHYFPIIFATISWAYFLIALTLSIIRKFSGEKIQALEDFEPDDEEDEE